MANIIITGVNGLLGQKLLWQATPQHTVLGVDIHEQAFVKKVKFEYQRLDITERHATRDTVLNFYPEFIVNTAAMTDVDACEEQREQCWKVNVQALENLIYAARKIGSKIIHLSTDYVFDGKNGPYSENDICSPLGYYGKSKLASENV
ncbi:MAG: sugar nucleotide-binding protein, partial [bacterium]|nr:sugar nucleotide-binding protein [bacterium]